MKILKICLTLLFIVSTGFQISYAASGFQFPLKRYVYPEQNSNGISVTLTNNTKIPYLLESWVSSADNITLLPVSDIRNDNTPFIILPPLTKLEPQTTFSWRVRRTGDSVNGKKIPEDRESLFWIGMKAIPAENKMEESGFVLKISPEFYFKLLYRPKAIENIELKDIEDKIIFTRTETELLVKNLSPLFITFDELMVGKINLNDDNNPITLQPFSIKSLAIPKEQIKDIITWRISDENLFPLSVHVVK